MNQLFRSRSSLSALCSALFLLFAGLTALSSLSCSQGAREQDQALPKVVVTTGMIADLVAALCGEQVELVQLMGSGVDPHLYKPTSADVQQLLSADLVVYNGFHLEGKMGEVLEKLESSAQSDTAVLALAPALDRDRLIQVGADDYDPHLWMDVSLWAAALEPLAQELRALLTTEAQQQELIKHQRSYREELLALDATVRAEIATLPKERRVLVTAHDAFQYFGKAYDIEVIGVQGLSTDSEAGLGRIEQLVELFSERRIPAVFVESSVSDKSVQALIEGARSRGHEVKIGGELFSDAMGEEGTPAGSYQGMMKHNLKTIVSALR